MRPLILAAFLSTLSLVATAAETTAPLRYTFSWPITSDSSLAPRGGTTKGAPVQFDTEPSEAWRALQEPGIDTRERDRRAILAMAGGYQVVFDFLEVVDFRPDSKRPRPYQSWGTEYVYVAQNRPDFVSLEHVLVMRIVGEDGKIGEPLVAKHWRQDWSYENRSLIEYVGRDTWQRRTLDPQEVRGTWTQAVYQIDESPRYESWGRWEHSPSASTWISADTWRPLPRRESSVRKDYDVLIGTNRHTILPTGWVQEENNLKAVLQDTGSLRASFPYLGREYGVARYQRIRDFNFDPGNQYFERTRDFWLRVRDASRARFASTTARIRLADAMDANGATALLEYADRLAAGMPRDESRERELLAKSIDAAVPAGN